MASEQPPATMENLPSDVLSNIFIRLSAKQLAQMRCVSKTWNALLSQSSFVKSHLRRSIHNNDKVFLFFYVVYNNGSEPFLVHPSRSPDLELTNFIKLPSNLRSEGASVGGSVNGLICLYYGSDECALVHIWNPSLSAVLTLPPHSTPSRGSDLINIHFRFGFEPKADDYKVIKLANLMDRKGDGFFDISRFAVKEWLPVEVYSMRKGSWQLITQRFPSHITAISRQLEVCVDGHDGHLHWLGFRDDKWELQTIVAFDLGVETFREIPLPVSIHHNVFNRFNVLGSLNGKLCVISCVRYGKCEVWVMDKYGVTESWVKHHVYSQFSGNIVPYGFTLHNEFFFRDDNDSHNEFFFEDDSFSLALYDPIAAKVNSVKTTGRSLRVRKVVDYVDSLVWIAPSEHDIMQI